MFRRLTPSLIEDIMPGRRTGSGHWRRRLAEVLAVVLLAMQSLVAAQACVLPLAAARGPTLTAHCPGAGTSLSACLIQCQKTADQLRPSVDSRFDALPAAKLWAPTLLAVPASCGPSNVSPILSGSGGPSLQILFCSFQS